MVNLITAIPFDPDMNLGRAYNNVMRRLDDDDWCCFIDHDVMFTTNVWHRQICNVIEAISDIGILTCFTNRIGNVNQWYPTGYPKENAHDIIEHRKFGSALALDEDTITDITYGPLISGMLICMSKKVWIKIGGFKDGFLGVDNQAHKDVRAIGYKVYRINGLYVYHWYRADGEQHKDAPICKV